MFRELSEIIRVYNQERGKWHPNAEPLSIPWLFSLALGIEYKDGLEKDLVSWSQQFKHLPKPHSYEIVAFNLILLALHLRAEIQGADWPDFQMLEHELAFAFQYIRGHVDNGSRLMGVPNFAATSA